uniref:Tctex1 domain-containing protein 2 n=1 Tax=Cacopsylla melanoneura TaxID=428564 RepID=A0A8D9ACM0_9HEMI
MGDNEDQEELKPPNFAILDHEEDEAGGDTSPDFKIKPALNDKFQAGKAKEIIRGALEDEFKGKAYDGDQSKNIVKRLSREIKTKIEAITHQNYKIVVEVTLVEQRGAGIRSDVKCIWDADADTLASDVFISDQLVCHATVFGRAIISLGQQIKTFFVFPMLWLLLGALLILN